jgi:hypothetical protein
MDWHKRISRKLIGSPGLVLLLLSASAVPAIPTAALSSEAENGQAERACATPKTVLDIHFVSFPTSAVIRRFSGFQSLPLHIRNGEMEYIRYLEATYGDVDRAMKRIGCIGQAPGLQYAVYRTGDILRDAWCSIGFWRVP